MKILNRKATATVLASMLILLAACDKDSPTVPNSSGPSSGRTTSGTIDSTARVSGATNDVITALSTISLQSGDNVTVTVTSNECSGNPESVNMNGIISGLVASGSCAGGLVGQGGTFGPASADGTIFFTATHPAFGTGPAGAVSGAYPNYTVGLNDGYGDNDFNDVVLAVHVIRELGELTCTPGPVRGQEVNCTVTGNGINVTGWTWTGPAYENPNLILRVTGPTSGNTWKGPAVTSGDVSVEVTVNGVPRSSPLTSSFTVQQRTGDAWSWGPNLHWKYTEGTGKNCGSGTMDYFEGTIVGWNRRTGGCTLGMLTPDPYATSTNGYSVKAATSGPNTGIWYVSTLTYKMLRESQINDALTPTSGLSHTLVDASEKAECSANAGKTITKANFYFFNATCKKLDVSGYVAGIWRHEGYGTTNGSGHQAQFEMAASLVEYSLYNNEEAVYAVTQADARTTVVALARSIDDGIRAHGGHEEPVDGKNWVGSLFLWAASQLRFIDRLIYT